MPAPSTSAAGGGQSGGRERQRCTAERSALKRHAHRRGDLDRHLVRRRASPRWRRRATRPATSPTTWPSSRTRASAGGYHFTHPEGWAQSVHGSSVTFTDKLNGVEVTAGASGTAPSVSSARATDVPALQHNQPAFELRSVKAVSVPAGKGVLIVYRRNSAPDQVTGRQYRDEVQRYELAGGNRSVVVELFGPVGADNVDAYRTMIQSLRLS